MLAYNTYVKIRDFTSVNSGKYDCSKPFIYKRIFKCNYKTTVIDANNVPKTLYYRCESTFEVVKYPDQEYLEVLYNSNHCHRTGMKHFQYSRVSKNVLSLVAAWFKDGYTMEKVRSNINAMNLNVRDKFVPNKTLRRIKQTIEKSVYANAQDDESSTAIWIEKLRSSGELIHFAYDDDGGIELAFCPALGKHCLGNGVQI